jgi:hypothetical protein
MSAAAGMNLKTMRPSSKRLQRAPELMHRSLPTIRLRPQTKLLWSSVQQHGAVTLRKYKGTLHWQSVIVCLHLNTLSAISSRSNGTRIPSKTRTSLGNRLELSRPPKPLLCQSCAI